MTKTTGMVKFYDQKVLFRQQGQFCKSKLRETFLLKKIEVFFIIWKNSLRTSRLPLFITFSFDNSRKSFSWFRIWFPKRQKTLRLFHFNSSLRRNKTTAMKISQGDRSIETSTKNIYISSKLGEARSCWNNLDAQLHLSRGLLLLNTWILWGGEWGNIDEVVENFTRQEKEPEPRGVCFFFLVTT